MRGPLDRVALGRTDVSVSRLGFGSAPLGGLLRETLAEDARDAVDAAWEAGLRSFDTAPQYGGGLAEQRLGATLAGRPREALTISSKVGKLVIPGGKGPSIFVGAAAHQIAYDYSYGGVMRSLEASLQRTGLDRFDILLIHDVNRKYHGDRVFDRFEEALSGACRALRNLREQGVIRAFGPALNEIDIALRFVREADVDCIMLPGRYTLLDRTAEAELLPECFSRQVGVLLAAPFESGILATGATPGASFAYAPADGPTLQRVAEINGACRDHGVPLAAAALQFPLSHPAIVSVVAGMRSRAEVEANLALMRTPIPPGLWAALDEDGISPLRQADKRPAAWPARPPRAGPNRTP